MSYDDYVEGLREQLLEREAAIYGLGKRIHELEERVRDLTNELYDLGGPEDWSVDPARPDEE